MLQRMDKLIGYTVVANDGDVGTVRDFYFDDRRWAVRYLVVETGSWLASRRVLISPLAISDVDLEKGALNLRLSREQVRGSPDIDTHKPVSRQHEISYFNYYGYPDYLSGPLLWGLTPYPMIPEGGGLPLTTDAIADSAAADESSDENHLRSGVDIRGWHLQASDDEIGHLEDFIIERDSWALRYIVVDTANWWLGRHVVVPVQWIEALDQDLHTVKVDVRRAQIRSAPEFDPLIELSRDYETQLFQHYQRPGYWY